MKLKYPVKTGGCLYPKGTEIRQATLQEMKAEWPGISEEPSSVIIGVWFEGQKNPTIISKKSVDLEE